jgi:outer membrane protein assembly factor BamB
MAGIFRGQGSAIARSLALLPALFLAVLTPSVAMAQLYEQPVLVIDPGVHTAPISSVAVDASGFLAVTGSFDKTLRVWSPIDGKLLQTIRVPAGPNNIGKIYAVAVSGDGALAAAGGWTRWAIDKREHFIYLFEPRTGKMMARIAGLSVDIKCLAFSPNGRYLAAGLGSGEGLHIYGRDRLWSEVLHDNNYGGDIYGVAFATDGRLATTSFDGHIRLYDPAFKLIVPPVDIAFNREGPFHVAFSPDGKTLAVGYMYTKNVRFFDGHSLTLMPGPNLDGVTDGNLAAVAWAKDGKAFYAGGRYYPDDGHYRRPIFSWADAGRGARRALPAADNTIFDLATLPDGGLVVAAGDPLVGVLEPDGRPRWVHSPQIADFRGQGELLAVSTDGTIVDFGFDQWGKSPLRFDLRALKLSRDPTADHQTTRAKLTGLAVGSWRGGFAPTLDGSPLYLLRGDLSRSLAIHHDENQFVLGTEWSLLAINAKGQRLWQREVPGAVWAVNISGDGRLVIAAYGDGTIRWHRMDDGRELLALFVLADKQNWVAWTPEGFYGATAGAFGVLQWQVNRGFDAAADTVPVYAIPKLRRPEALALVLQWKQHGRWASLT